LVVACFGLFVNRYDQFKLTVWVTREADPMVPGRYQIAQVEVELSYTSAGTAVGTETFTATAVDVTAVSLKKNYYLLGCCMILISTDLVIILEDS
jgi:hypothetical protein